MLGRSYAKTIQSQRKVQHMEWENGHLFLKQEYDRDNNPYYRFIRLYHNGMWKQSDTVAAPIDGKIVGFSFANDEFKSKISHNDAVVDLRFCKSHIYGLF